MRLICPNCGAQYEVPDEVIPKSGRDVQCSDCGNTWFQNHSDHQPEEPDNETRADDDWVEDAGVVEDNGDDFDEPESNDPQSNEETASDTFKEDSQEAFGENSGSSDSYEEIYEENSDAVLLDPEPESAAFARKLDPSVAEVLREEAAFEERARADNSSGLETQEELGLDGQGLAAQQRSEEARARMARLRGAPDEHTEADEPEDIDLDEHTSRRNLLPDIDELSSSLGPEQSSSDVVASATTDATAVHVPPKSGFRTGFRLAILLIFLALLLYIFAPKLAEAVPALAGPLGQYTDMVNSGRTALDGMLTNFASSLSEE